MTAQLEGLTPASASSDILNSVNIVFLARTFLKHMIDVTDPAALAAQLDAGGWAAQRQRPDVFVPILLLPLCDAGATPSGSESKVEPALVELSSHTLVSSLLDFVARTEPTYVHNYVLEHLHLTGVFLCAGRTRMIVIWRSSTCCWSCCQRSCDQRS